MDHYKCDGWGENEKKYARESEFRKKDLKQKKLKKQNFVQIELHCRAY